MKTFHNKTENRSWMVDEHIAQTRSWMITEHITETRSWMNDGYCIIMLQ